MELIYLNFFLLILLIAIVIIIAIIFIPIYIEFIIMKKKKNSTIGVKLILLKGLFKFQYEIEYLDLVAKINMKGYKLDEKKVESYKIKEKKGFELEYIIEQFHNLRKNLSLFRNIIQYIVEKIILESLSLNARFGLGDAALTGITYGALWAVMGVFLNVLYSNKDVKNLSVKLCPDFNETILEVDFFCIIKIKFAHIIIASIKGIKVLIKGGVLNGRSSYSRSNEDNNGEY